MAKLIDLSHPLEDGQIGFPGDPPFHAEVCGTIAEIGYNLTRICTSSHHGTHVDAPYHFYDDGKTLDALPLERLFGPAVLVDLAPGTMLPPKSPITVPMLQAHEAKFRPGARVLYRTGWDRRFNRPEFFSDYPTLTVEAARWIADKRIGLLGMDTGTPSTDWKEVHLTLMQRGVEIILIEGLANLDKLPEWFTLIAFPLNIRGRDGSPVRAVAWVEP